MAGGNGGLVAAAIFGLIVTTAGLTASLMTWTGPTYQDQESPYASPERYEAAQLIGNSATNYAAYPVSDSNACYSSNNHDSADLCAQWRAAIAAEKATDYARWGNWIAGMGAILSFVSIVLVLRALKQTEEANGIARDTAERELRAYVDFRSVEFVSPEIYPYQDGKGDNALYQSGVIIHIKNFGSTPAYQVQVRSTGQVFENDVGERYAWELESNLTVIAPGDCVPARMNFPMEKGVMDQVKIKFWSYRFVPVVEYLDAFDAPQTLEAAFISDGLDGPFLFESGSKKLT